MLRTIALIFMLMVLTAIKPNSIHHETSHKIIDAVSVSVTPANPLIEKDQNGQYLNFDIVIKNTSTHTISLATIEVAVIDASVKAVVRRSVNMTGQGTGVTAAGNNTLKPGESITVFNPLYSLAPDIKITFLQYEFLFNYADSPQQRENNKKRVAADFDLSVKKVITPRLFIPKTDLGLPLKGKLIVLDQHNLSAGTGSLPGQPAKANRYALGLAGVDGSGNMYAADAFKRENWYSFDKPIYAPAGGVVAEVQNDIPDNDFTGKKVRFPAASISTDPTGMGNYVIIDHGNGEFSVLAHLQKGSIIVRNGMLVKPGELIGKVGFSGNISFPYLYYAVINGPKPQLAEGVPSYFNNYKLFRGNTVIAIKKGRLGNGDIIEQGK